MLASQAAVDTMVALQGDDSLTFVDTLDRASKREAQKIVDMLDKVRQSENEYP